MRGFTLAEILIGVVITTVVLGMGMSIIIGVQKHTTRLGNLTQVRQAVDGTQVSVGRDIQSASQLIPTDQNTSILTAMATKPGKFNVTSAMIPGAAGTNAALAVTPNNSLFMKMPFSDPQQPAAPPGAYENKPVFRQIAKQRKYAEAYWLDVYRRRYKIFKWNRTEKVKSHQVKQRYQKKIMQWQQLSWSRQHLFDSVQKYFLRFGAHMERRYVPFSTASRWRHYTVTIPIGGLGEAPQMNMGVDLWHRIRALQYRRYLQAFDYWESDSHYRLNEDWSAINGSYWMYQLGHKEHRVFTKMYSLMLRMAFEARFSAIVKQRYMMWVVRDKYHLFINAEEKKRPFNRQAYVGEGLIAEQMQPIFVEARQAKWALRTNQRKFKLQELVRQYQLQNNLSKYADTVGAITNSNQFTLSKVGTLSKLTAAGLLVNGDPVILRFGGSQEVRTAVSAIDTGTNKITVNPGWSTANVAAGTEVYILNSWNDVVNSKITQGVTATSPPNPAPTFVPAVNNLSATGASYTSSPDVVTYTVGSGWTADGYKDFPLIIDTRAINSTAATWGTATSLVMDPVLTDPAWAPNNRWQNHVASLTGLCDSINIKRTTNTTASATITGTNASTLLFAGLHSANGDRVCRNDVNNPTTDATATPIMNSNNDNNGSTLGNTPTTLNKATHNHAIFTFANPSIPTDATITAAKLNITYTAGASSSPEFAVGITNGSATNGTSSVNDITVWGNTGTSTNPNTNPGSGTDWNITDVVKNNATITNLNNQDLKLRVKNNVAPNATGSTDLSVSAMTLTITYQQSAAPGVDSTTDQSGNSVALTDNIPKAAHKYKLVKFGHPAFNPAVGGSGGSNLDHVDTIEMTIPISNGSGAAYAGTLELAVGTVAAGGSTSGLTLTTKTAQTATSTSQTLSLSQAEIQTLFGSYAGLETDKDLYLRIKNTTGNETDGLKIGAITTTVNYRKGNEGAASTTMATSTVTDQAGGTTTLATEQKNVSNFSIFKFAVPSPNIPSGATIDNIDITPTFTTSGGATYSFQLGKGLTSNDLTTTIGAASTSRTSGAAWDVKADVTGAMTIDDLNNTGADAAKYLRLRVKNTAFGSGIADVSVSALTISYTWRKSVTPAKTAIANKANIAINSNNLPITIVKPTSPYALFSFAGAALPNGSAVAGVKYTISYTTSNGATFEIQPGKDLAGNDIQTNLGAAVTSHATGTDLNISSAQSLSTWTTDVNVNNRMKLRFKNTTTDDSGTAKDVTITGVTLKIDYQIPPPEPTSFSIPSNQLVTTVRGNTANTLSVTRNFASDLGLGATDTISVPQRGTFYRYVTSGDASYPKFLDVSTGRSGISATVSGNTAQTAPSNLQVMQQVFRDRGNAPAEVQPLDSGDTANVVSSTTGITAVKTWTADQWVGYGVMVYDTAGGGKYVINPRFGVITGNTATTLTYSGGLKWADGTSSGIPTTGTLQKFAIVGYRYAPTTGTDVGADTIATATSAANRTAKLRECGNPGNGDPTITNANDIFATNFCFTAANAETEAKDKLVAGGYITADDTSKYYETIWQAAAEASPPTPSIATGAVSPQDTDAGNYFTYTNLNTIRWTPIRKASFSQAPTKPFQPNSLYDYNAATAGSYFTLTASSPINTVQNGSADGVLDGSVYVFMRDDDGRLKTTGTGASACKITPAPGAGGCAQAVDALTDAWGMNFSNPFSGDSDHRYVWNITHIRKLGIPSAFATTPTAASGVRHSLVYYWNLHNNGNGTFNADLGTKYAGYNGDSSIPDLPLRINIKENGGNTDGPYTYVWLRNDTAIEPRGTVTLTSQISGMQPNSVSSNNTQFNYTRWVDAPEPDNEFVCNAPTNGITASGNMGNPGNLSLTKGANPFFYCDPFTPLLKPVYQRPETAPMAFLNLFKNPPPATGPYTSGARVDSANETDPYQWRPDPSKDRWEALAPSNGKSWPRFISGTGDDLVPRSTNQFMRFTVAPMHQEGNVVACGTGSPVGCVADQWYVYSWNETTDSGGPTQATVTDVSTMGDMANTGYPGPQSGTLRFAAVNDASNPTAITSYPVGSFSVFAAANQFLRPNTWRCASSVGGTVTACDASSGVGVPTGTAKFNANIQVADNDNNWQFDKHESNNPNQLFYTGALVKKALAADGNTRYRSDNVGFKYKALAPLSGSYQLCKNVAITYSPPPAGTTPSCTGTGSSTQSFAETRIINASEIMTTPDGTAIRWGDLTKLVKWQNLPSSPVQDGYCLGVNANSCQSSAADNVNDIPTNYPVGTAETLSGDVGGNGGYILDNLGRPGKVPLFPEPKLADFPLATNPGNGKITGGYVDMKGVLVPTVNDANNEISNTVRYVVYSTSWINTTNPSTGVGADRKEFAGNLLAFNTSANDADTTRYKRGYAMSNLIGCTGQPYVNTNLINYAGNPADPTAAKLFNGGDGTICAVTPVTTDGHYVDAKASVSIQADTMLLKYYYRYPNDVDPSTLTTVSANINPVTSKITLADGTPNTYWFRYRKKTPAAGATNPEWDPDVIGTGGPGFSTLYSQRPQDNVHVEIHQTNLSNQPDVAASSRGVAASAPKNRFTLNWLTNPSKNTFTTAPNDKFMFNPQLKVTVTDSALLKGCNAGRTPDYTQQDWTYLHYCLAEDEWVAEKMPFNPDNATSGQNQTNDNFWGSNGTMCPGITNPWFGYRAARDWGTGWATVPSGYNHTENKLNDTSGGNPNPFCTANGTFTGLTSYQQYQHLKTALLNRYTPTAEDKAYGYDVQAGACPATSDAPAQTKEVLWIDADHYFNWANCPGWGIQGDRGNFEFHAYSGDIASIMTKWGVHSSLANTANHDAAGRLNPGDYVRYLQSTGYSRFSGYAARAAGLAPKGFWFKNTGFNGGNGILSRSLTTPYANNVFYDSDHALVGYKAISGGVASSGETDCIPYNGSACRALDGNDSPYVSWKASEYLIDPANHPLRNTLRNGASDGNCGNGLTQYTCGGADLGIHYDDPNGDGWYNPSAGGITHPRKPTVPGDDPLIWAGDAEGYASQKTHSITTQGYGYGRHVGFGVGTNHYWPLEYWNPGQSGRSAGSLRYTAHPNADDTKLDLLQYGKLGLGGFDNNASLWSGNFVTWTYRIRNTCGDNYGSCVPYHSIGGSGTLSYGLHGEFDPYGTENASDPKITTSQLQLYNCSGSPLTSGGEGCVGFEQLPVPTPGATDSDWVQHPNQGDFWTGTGGFGWNLSIDDLKTRAGNDLAHTGRQQGGHLDAPPEHYGGWHSFWAWWRPGTPVSGQVRSPSKNPDAQALWKLPCGRSQSPAKCNFTPNDPQLIMNIGNYDKVDTRWATSETMHYFGQANTGNAADYVDLHSIATNDAAFQITEVFIGWSPRRPSTPLSRTGDSAAYLGQDIENFFFLKVSPPPPDVPVSSWNGVIAGATSYEIPRDQTGPRGAINMGNNGAACGDGSTPRQGSGDVPGSIAGAWYCPGDFYADDGVPNNNKSLAQLNRPFFYAGELTALTLRPLNPATGLPTSDLRESDYWSGSGSTYWIEGNRMRCLDPSYGGNIALENAETVRNRGPNNCTPLSGPYYGPGTAPFTDPFGASYDDLGDSLSVSGTRPAGGTFTDVSYAIGAESWNHCDWNYFCGDSIYNSDSGSIYSSNYGGRMSKLSPYVLRQFRIAATQNPSLSRYIYTIEDSGVNDGANAVNGGGFYSPAFQTDNFRQVKPWLDGSNPLGKRPQDYDKKIALTSHLWYDSGLLTHLPANTAIPNSNILLYQDAAQMSNRIPHPAGMTWYSSTINGYSGNVALIPNDPDINFKYTIASSGWEQEMTGKHSIHCFRRMVEDSTLLETDGECPGAVYTDYQPNWQQLSVTSSNNWFDLNPRGKYWMAMPIKEWARVDNQVFGSWSANKFTNYFEKWNDQSRFPLCLDASYSGCYSHRSASGTSNYAYYRYVDWEDGAVTWQNVYRDNTDDTAYANSFANTGGNMTDSYTRGNYQGVRYEQNIFSPTPWPPNPVPSASPTVNAAGNGKGGTYLADANSRGTRNIPLPPNIKWNDPVAGNLGYYIKTLDGDDPVVANYSGNRMWEYTGILQNPNSGDYDALSPAEYVKLHTVGPANKKIDATTPFMDTPWRPTSTSSTSVGTPPGRTGGNILGAITASDTFEESDPVRALIAQDYQPAVTNPDMQVNFSAYSWAWLGTDNADGFYNVPPTYPFAAMIGSYDYLNRATRPPESDPTYRLPAFNDYNDPKTAPFEVYRYLDKIGSSKEIFLKPTLGAVSNLPGTQIPLSNSWYPDRGVLAGLYYTAEGPVNCSCYNFRKFNATSGGTVYGTLKFHDYPAERITNNGSSTLSWLYTDQNPETNSQYYFEFNHPTSPRNGNAEWIPFGGAAGTRMVETGLTKIIADYTTADGTDPAVITSKYKPAIPTALAGLIDWIYGGVQPVPVRTAVSLVRDTSRKFNLMGYFFVPAVGPDGQPLYDEDQTDVATRRPVGTLYKITSRGPAGKGFTEDPNNPKTMVQLLTEVDPVSGVAALDHPLTVVQRVAVGGKGAGEAETKGIIGGKTRGKMLIREAIFTVGQTGATFDVTVSRNQGSGAEANFRLTQTYFTRSASTGGSGGTAP